MNYELFKSEMSSKSGKLNPNTTKDGFLEAKKPECYLYVIKNTSDKYDLKLRIKLAFVNLFEPLACKTCGEPVAFMEDFCSRKCSANSPDVLAKKLAAQDTKARGAKAAESLKKLYASDLGKEKKAEQLKKRYDNHDGAFYSDEGLAAVKSFDRNVNKAKETSLARYGVDNYAKTKEFSLSVQKRRAEYKRVNGFPVGAKHWTNQEVIYNKERFELEYNLGGTDAIMQLTGCSRGIVYDYAIEYGIRERGVNIAEQEIIQFIESLGLSAVQNSRKIISPFELDIFIESHNLAIEFNGLYWHSDEFKEKRYHLDKTEMCEAKGITLLHIFENEWRDFKDKWKSVIKTKLGLNSKIHARKCKLVLIDNKTAADFCEENHLQGKHGCSFAYGLYHNDNLVQVATFGKSRFSTECDLELIRMCTKMGYTVVGGASKITSKVDSFISYANRRWSSGNVYSTINMQQLKPNPPTHAYVKGDKVYNRIQFLHHKLKYVLETYDEKLSSMENMKENGFTRIWDCGNLVFKK